MPEKKSFAAQVLLARQYRQSFWPAKNVVVSTYEAKAVFIFHFQKSQQDVSKLFIV